MSTLTERAQRRTTSAWTALLAVIAVGHHLGTLLAGLGPAGNVQQADLVDLLLPYAVVAAGGVALLAVPRSCQVAGVVGLVLYVQGHGIHLAANSIAERQASPAAFFWDELAGHAIWYAGLYLLLGALLVGRAVASRPGPVRLVLSVAVGVTFATNALGGHAVPLAVGACLVLGVLAARARQGLAVDVLLAAVCGLLSLAAIAVS
ncbi:MAG: hypothetical protein H7323_02185 [Frankiales bacterium]|nr:hypothetical protein [Frankiales bacterium]